MQHQFDLLIFLLSNAVLVCWCVFVFNYKGKPTLFLNLSKTQIIVLLIIEVALFAGMYLNYEIYKSPDVADGFAWHYSIIYARGVLPLAGLSSINDKILGSKEDPILACLVVGLTVDYFVLLLCSVITSIKKR